MRVNDTLTLDFAGREGDCRRPALCVSRKRHRIRDAILQQRDPVSEADKDAGLTFGSGPEPGGLEDGKLNDWNGGRGFYYKDHDGHVIELMTMPQ